MSPGNKRNLLIVSGTLLGAFFLYLAFRDVSWAELMDGVSKVQPIYFLPCALLTILLQLVRAVRFGVILSPFCSLGTRQLWDLLNIWAAASMVMPARLGELVRPYLLQRRGVSFSSVFGAVMVERFFDLLGLLVLLAVVLGYSPEVSKTYSFWGGVLLAVLLVAYAMVLFMLAYRDRTLIILKWCLSWLPKRPATLLEGILIRLVDGFGIMASFRQALVLFGCSVLIWGLFSCLTFLFLVAFSIHTSFLVAVTIQVFICFGVALPSAPGFIGTFHAACRYALAVFGIQSVVAVSFATVYHLFSLIMCLLLGIFSYLTSDFRLDQAMLSGQPQDTPSAGGAAALPENAVPGSGPGEPDPLPPR